jgi:DNA (cytosine-5)-methyltransferase 1
MVVLPQYNWLIKDIDSYASRTGLNNLSFFSGAGGTSLGSRLAGNSIVEYVEMDKDQNLIRKANSHPLSLHYENDIRDYKYTGSYEIDIIETSPPCTAFSTSGLRDKGWGKLRKHEGNKSQTLEDLIFVSANKCLEINPKIIIMENVLGLTMGRAREQLKKYVRLLKDYKTYVFVIDSSTCGVPQIRKRVFAISYRIKHTKPDMKFFEKPILYKDIKTEEGEDLTDYMKNLIVNYSSYGDKTLSDCKSREINKESLFSHKFIYPNELIPTLTTNAEGTIDYEAMKKISLNSIIKASTFPLDYNWCEVSKRKIIYACGMCVPPILSNRVMLRVLDSICL